MNCPSHNSQAQPVPHIPVDGIIPIKHPNIITDTPWACPGQVLIYLLFNPPVREWILKEVYHRGQMANKHLIIELYHPLFKRQLIINSHGNDRLFLHSILNMMYWEEGVWTRIPEGWCIDPQY